MGKFKRWLNDVVKDNQFNYHKQNCYFRNYKFTVIRNGSAMKMSELSIKYCPICGEELKQ